MLMVINYLDLRGGVGWSRVDKIVADQLTQFEHNIEADLQKAMEIIAKNALLSASDYVVGQGAPVANSTLAIENLINCGTVDCQPGSVPLPLMINNTLGIWTDRFEARAPESGFSLDISYSNVRVRPYDSFHMHMSVEFTVLLESRTNTSRIYRTVEKNATVAYYNLEDPAFALNSMLFVRHLVRQSTNNPPVLLLAEGTAASGTAEGAVTFNTGDPSPSGKVLFTHNMSLVPSPENFAGVVANASDVKGGYGGPYIVGVSSMSASQGQSAYLDSSSKKAWGLSGLRNDTAGGYYHESEAGAGYLDRLEGRTTVSAEHAAQSGLATGLESFIDTAEFSAVQLPVKGGETCLDYLHFNNDTDSGSHVRGMDDWFLLDAGTAGRYNITGLLD